MNNEQAVADMKIMDCQIEIIQIMSEIQDLDCIVNDSHRYLKMTYVKVKDAENTLMRMGIVKDTTDNM